MSELVLSRRASFAIAIACFALGGYCIQYALLADGAYVPLLYIAALVLFATLALAISQGVRFSGLNLVQPNRWVVGVFWVAIGSIVVAYVAELLSTSTGQKSAHFVVGIFLLVYFGWLRDVARRGRRS